MRKSRGNKGNQVFSTTPGEIALRNIADSRRGVPSEEGGPT
ncbi:MAG: hypothetical protein U9Q76_07125 [candidate division WOR-3 bacterium]|nr:hypothetical protein [candidate division WOR-3 bacterium]